MNWKNYLEELKRRNVIKAAAAYIIFCWLVAQVASIFLPAFEAPPYMFKTLVFILCIVFPFWLIFSWIYEITPEGIKKTSEVPKDKSTTAETNLRLNKVIIGCLVIVGGLMVFNIFTAQPAVSEPIPGKILSIAGEDPKKSIAVLAFEDMSQEKDQQYFSDGISEEILNLLVQLSELKVISRTSSFSFKGTNSTTEEIGEALNVSHILEGSVRKSGNVLRITAQLINVKDGAHLWSATYDRNLEDIFKIQDEIAAMVTKELKLNLLGIYSKTVDPEAYNLYLKGKYLRMQNTREGNINAEDFLKQSIAIDSTYTPAWALLGLVQTKSGTNYMTRPSWEALDLGIKSLEKAIALDPKYAFAYSELAYARLSQYNFEEAGRLANKALELEPENQMVLIRSTFSKFADLEEKITIIKKVIELDPLEYHHYYVLGLVSYWNNDLEGAKKALDVFTKQFPNADVWHHVLARVYLAEGENEAALREIEKESDVFFKLYAKIMVMFALGREEEADDLLAEMIENYPEPSNIADIYAFMGDADNTFLWLEKALATKDPTLTEALYYPTFKVVHKDPRWNQFLAKMALPAGHGIPGAQ